MIDKVLSGKSSIDVQLTGSRNHFGADGTPEALDPVRRIIACGVSGSQEPATG